MTRANDIFQIPTINMYYMLAYGYDVLTEGEFKHVEICQEDTMHDLLAEILIKGITGQMMKGACKEYVPCEDAAYMLKGKLDINMSIRLKSQMDMKLYCQYDEFSEDNIFNQILKATAISLMKRGKITSTRKKHLKRLLFYFTNVKEISLRSVRWSTLSYQNSNATYKALINICHLAFNGLMTDEAYGGSGEKVSLKERTLKDLYNKFIFQFFVKECPKLKVKYEGQKRWLHSQQDNTFSDMKTYISISNADARLIIGAQVDEEHLKQKSEDDEKAFILKNMGAVYTAVKYNSFNERGPVSGMFLYPTMEVAYREAYEINGHKIYVQTINLLDSFEVIKAQLLAIKELIK